MFSGTNQLKQLEISGLDIHKIDIGKVKTSKNVMKLLKLLLTVIVKHPVLSLWNSWNFPLEHIHIYWGGRGATYFESEIHVESNEKTVSSCVPPP